MFTTPRYTRKIAEFLAKPEVKEMSAGLEEIAQAVAVAVEDKALTERIYEKCMEKFDGETNTLWMHLEADSKVKAQGGWNKRVDAELSKGRKNATVKGIGNVEAAVKKFEKTMNAPLHLFWAFPANWDKKATPLVAFVGFDQNPKTRTGITAFDAKGNRFELGKDGAEAKQRPVLVLTYNERSSMVGEVKSKNTSVPNTITGNNTSPKNSAKLASIATSIGPDYVRVPDWADEFWWDGGPEYIYTFKKANYSNTVIGEIQWNPEEVVVLGPGAPVNNLWYVQFSPGTTHSLVLPSGQGQPYASIIEFEYYEDDSSIGVRDIFDDFCYEDTFVINGFGEQTGTLYGGHQPYTKY